MATKNKAKPKDLGTGGARKAANAIVKRKKANEAALNAAKTGGKKKPAKPSTPAKGPSSSSYKDYQLQKAKEQLKKKKKK